MHLFVNTYGSRVGVSGGRIVVYADGDVVKSYPSNSIESVTLFPGTNITPQLIKVLSEKEKNVFWVDSFGKTYASLIFPKSESIVRKKMQFDLLDNMDFKTGFARKIIDAKINNQTWLLTQVGGCGFSGRQQEINRIRLSLNKADSISTIMGLEGAAARIYFECISEVLPEKWRFTKRTKHPPRDSFSALLSFIYMLLYNEIVAALRFAGFDPDIGIMHSVRDGHHALSSDLMEEFRPILCDRIALEMIRSGLITTEDFSLNDDDSVYLNHNSKKTVIAGFFKEMNSKTEIKKKTGIGQNWKNMIEIQICELLRAISLKNPKAYKPLYESVNDD